MKKASMILAMLMVLSLVLGSIGCGGGKSETGVEVVKVGAVLPLSGYLGTVGRDLAAGLRYVVTEINAAGGIKGMDGAKLEIMVVDDKSDPSLSATEAERLITEKGVVIVFIASDEVTQALCAPLADKYKVPIMAMGSYDSAVTAKGYSYYWGGIGSSSYPGSADVYKAFLGMVINDYHQAPKTVGLLSYQATDIQKGRVNILLPAFSEFGLTVVIDEIHTDEVSSWDTYALKLKEAKPDIFLSYTDPYSCSELLKALDRLGYLPPTALWLALNWTSGRATLGEDVAHRTLDQPGQFTTATMVNDTSYSVALDFRSRYEAANGVGTYGRPIMGAQAMYLLVRAIREGNSADPEAINDALAQISIPEGDPDLIVPPYCPELRFTETTHELVNQGMVVAQWQNGNCYVVRPFHFATTDAQFRS